MIRAGTLQELLRRRGIACEGSSSAELQDFEVVEGHQLPQLQPGTLAFLAPPYPRERWEEAHRLCLDLEAQGCLALIRADSAPEGALRISPQQPLGPVLRLLEEVFLLSGPEGLLDLLGRRGSVDEVVELLGRELGHCAFVEIPSRRTLAVSGSEAFSRQIRQLPLHELLGIYPHRTVQSETAALGYLFSYPYQSPSSERLLDHGAAVLARILERHQRGLRSQGRRREELLRRLLFSTEAERQDLPPQDLRDLSQGPSAVLVCGFGKAKVSAPAQEALQDRFQAFFPRAPLTWLEGRLVALVQQEPELRQRLLQLLEAPQWGACQMGLGAFHQDLRDLPQGYGQALRALKLSEELVPPAVLFWEDCDLQSLLLPLLESQETVPFIQRHLGPLLQEPELLRTLETLILWGWRQSAAAKALALHYNTLRYRIDRIQQLLGRPLSPHQGKSLTLALELHKLSQRLPGGAPSPQERARTSQE